jgi:molybdate transport repressor ModE-like protein
MSVAMASLPDAGRMRVLREVALRGTIAGAARALGLTASAVSQQITALEREVGAPLLDRSPRGVALTGAGHVLAERAAQLMEVLAAARADLDRLTGAAGGPVTVAAVASAAATVVSDAVLALRSANPAVEPSVRAAEPQQALGLLLAGDVDVAVVDEYDYVPLALPENTVVRELCSEPLLLVAPSGTRLRPARPALADLATADWVMPPDDAACGQAVRAACRAAGFEPRVRWETDDMLLLARAVAAGHGLAVLPRRSIATGAVALRTVELTAPRLRRRIVAVARASAAARPVVRTMLDSLANAATEPVPRRP